MSNRLGAEFIQLCQNEPSDHEANQSLLFAMRQGDQKARQDLITNNASLVVWHVNKFIACYSGYAHLREDLVGEGFRVLIETIDSLRTPRTITHVGGYLGANISKAIGHYAERDATIDIPDRTKRRHRDRTFPTTESNDDAIKEINGSVDPRAMPELRDAIRASCRNMTERRLVEMLEANSTLAEMIEELDISQTTLYVMRQTIYARVLTKMGVETKAA